MRSTHGVCLATLLGGDVHLSVVAHLQHVVRRQILVRLVVRWLLTLPCKIEHLIFKEIVADPDTLIKNFVVVAVMKLSGKFSQRQNLGYLFFYLLVASRPGQVITKLNSVKIRNAPRKEVFLSMETIFGTKSKVIPS